jgi:hypothetical protein
VQHVFLAGAQAHEIDIRCFCRALLHVQFSTRRRVSPDDLSARQISCQMVPAGSCPAVASPIAAQPQSTLQFGNPLLLCDVFRLERRHSLLERGRQMLNLFNQLASDSPLPGRLCASARVNSQHRHFCRRLPNEMVPGRYLGGYRNRPKWPPDPPIPAGAWMFTMREPNRPIWPVLEVRVCGQM